MTDYMGILFFAAPIITGVITGFVIVYFLKRRWKSDMKRVHDQENEMKELISIE